MMMAYAAPAELVAIWKRREGFRARMYLDSKGIPTIGYGHNLRDVPISERAASVITEDDIETIAHQVAGVIGDDVWPALVPARQGALIDMGAMGPKRLAGFVRMIAAIRVGDWQTAHDECLASQWRVDVGDSRAGEVARMLLTGQWPS
jgi:lysozyme